MKHTFKTVSYTHLAMFLPISFLLSMIPSYESMAKQAIVRVFNTIMTRAGITLIVTVAFSISCMFYNTVSYTHLDVYKRQLDIQHIIKDILKLNINYMLHEDYGHYSYTEHYSLGDIFIYTSVDEEKGVLLELKGRGCRQFEDVYKRQTYHRAYHQDTYYRYR